MKPVTSMYLKYRAKIKPSHVFLINLLISFILDLGFLIFDTLFKLGTSQSSDFCPHYLAGLFLFITRYVDIFILQSDRFIAVFWCLQYKGLVTNPRAIYICVVAKVVAACLTASSLLLDRNYLVCEYPFQIIFTRNTTVRLVAFPTIAVGVVVAIVSICLGYKMVKLKKTVNPVVNLGQNNTVFPQESVTMSSIKRMEGKVDVFVKVEQATETREEDCEENRRSSQEMNDQSESNLSEVYLVARTALNMNYVVILGCIMYFIRAVLSIIYCECHFNDDCDIFVIVWKNLIPLRIVLVVSGCYVFYDKLKKNEIF